MALITTPRGPLHVVAAGQGEPLLLIHGFPLDHRMWSAQIEHFSDRFLVLAPDLRGYGQSAPLTGPVTLPDFAQDLLVVLEHFAASRPATICGLSMGGYLAWQLIRHWPDRISRLVLCHTRSAADSPETARGRRLAGEGIRQSGPNAFLQAMLERVLGATTREHHPAVVAAVWKWMLEAPSESLIHTLNALANRPDATPWLAAITCPVLVIAGAEDPITPAAEMQLMAGQIPGSEFVLLDEVGHLSPCESPQRFNAVLRAFLEK